MRQWIHKGPDGKEIRIDREKPVLKPEAVPEKYPNTKSYFNISTKRRKSPTIRPPIPAKRIYREREPVWEDEKEENGNPNHDTSTSETATNDSVGTTVTAPEHPKTTSLYEKAKEVKLPRMWAVFHEAENDEVLFCHLNICREVDKCVAFCKDSTEPNIYLSKKLVKIEIETTCKTKDDIENLLLHVHKLKLCPGSMTGHRSNDCKSYLQDFKNVNGKLIVCKATRCFPCIQHRATLMKQQKRKEKQVNKHNPPKWSLLKKRTQQKRRLAKKVSIIQHYCIRVLKPLCANLLITLTDTAHFSSQVEKLEKELESVKAKQRLISSQKLEDIIKDFTPKQKVMVRACVMAAKAKGPTGMRYTKEWVYECMLLRIKSPKLYRSIRRDKDRLLPLPSIQTLQRYMEQLRPIYGFQENVFSMLGEKAKYIRLSGRHGK